ncbi:hypothetical protein [Pontibacter sp. SGAir0037]|uniref:hypothetical protein n=1 Tax=Pontibacter sp. SGAir0037 TaxID=2571030 RepID=UPI0010CCC652|nr:hypothetical protein [Pontibacter sp. SGAir0037]QCR24758.1 hypothetical protein C1N53_21970 [Pontibacter sp. SGAir0037]
MIKVFVNNKQVDTVSDSKVAVTVQSNDLTKPDMVQSSYTNMLRLPGTNRNNSILENSNLVTSIAESPYRLLKVEVLHDGIELLPSAIGLLDSFEEDYNLQVFSGAVNFFEKLGDKSIRDLNLARFNHVRDLDNVATRGNPYRNHTHGYIYDLHYRGFSFNRGNLNPMHLYPSVFVRAIYAQMMEEAGVKWSFENDTFNRLLLPFTNGIPVHNQQWVEERQYNYFLTGTLTPSIPKHYGEVEITLTVNVTKLKSSKVSAPAFLLVALRDSDNFNLQPPVRLDISAVGQQEAKGTIKVSSIYNLNSISFVVQRENLVAQNGFSDAAWFSSAEIKASYKDEAYYKSDWSIADNLPDIKQKDFFKMVNSLFGLMPNYDVFSDMMMLVPMTQLETNKANALDWSKKLVYPAGKQPGISYRFGKFAQKNWFRYKSGSDADSFLPVDNNTLDYEVTVLELPVAASGQQQGYVDITTLEEERKVLSGYKHVVANVQGLSGLQSQTGDVAYVQDAASGNNYTRNESQYILKGGAVYRQSLGNWYYIDQEITYKPVKTEPRLTLHQPNVYQGVTLREKNETPGRSIAMAVSTFEGLDFTSLLKTYYGILKDILYRCKGLTPYFLLAAHEVQNYDCSVPIWLDQYQSYFYLNSINEYTGEGPTECQLWRL